VKAWLFRCTGAIVVAATLQLPAYASAPKGSRPENIRSAALRFGDCLARSYAPLGRAVVLANLVSEEITKWKQTKRLIDGSCLNQPASDDAIGPESALGMRFSSYLFPYFLADGLVRKDYPVPRQFDFAKVPPLTHRTVAPLPASLAADTSRAAGQLRARHHQAQTLILFSRFGECVARRAPSGVHQLLHSDALTKAEDAAFAELSIPMGECLSSGQLRFSREVVRGVLAVNFYRLAGAPAGAEVATLRDRPNA
jgi:hypothetical protein